MRVFLCLDAKPDENMNLAPVPFGNGSNILVVAENEDKAAGLVDQFHIDHDFWSVYVPEMDHDYNEPLPSKSYLIIEIDTTIPSARWADGN